MEKALEILKECLELEKIKMKGYEHLSNLAYIQEAIYELEESQLNRREWYQKGYNEAMKPKTCSSCCWWNDFYTQCNDHDNALAGVGDYGCNRHEPKDTQC